MEHGPFLTGGEKQPLVPRPSRKKCRRRHTAAIGNVNLAAGPLDKGEAGGLRPPNAILDRLQSGNDLGLGSLRRKMQHRFEMEFCGRLSWLP